MIGILIILLVLMGVLGYVAVRLIFHSFHPSAQEYVFVNDKVLHFSMFLMVRILRTGSRTSRQTFVAT